MVLEKIENICYSMKSMKGDERTSPCSPYPIEKVGPGRTMPEKPTEYKIPQDTTERQELFSERDINRD